MVHAHSKIHNKRHDKVVGVRIDKEAYDFYKKKSVRVLQLFSLQDRIDSQGEFALAAASGTPI